MRKEVLSNPPLKLKKKRKEIDLIDQKLLTLLNQRLRIVLEMGKIKKEMGKRSMIPKGRKNFWKGWN
jgi:chorismate mutase